MAHRDSGAPFQSFRVAVRNSMSCIPCIVFPTSMQVWMAHLENGSAGPFIDLDFALKIATTEALHLRRLGRPARVVVIDKDGKPAPNGACAIISAADRHEPAGGL
jgi:hypothetical protein